ncbi:MAG: DegT/DnrJ/EryC1/StrS family aminotransferase [Calditrichaeota bacterium]|nr:MAG: DegT/DnrJ/EryC1/StrS family aminotransferase [Calditrichota bacterium]
MNIQMVDLIRQYQGLKEEIDEAVARVLASARYINGPDVSAFAEEVARYLGVGYAIPCASGTDALQIAMMALEIGPGDEVITSPFTFIATAETIALLGARPVYVDIDPVTFNLDPAHLEAKITERTRAIIPVHLYGQPADMDPILEIARRHKLRVIEDAAQALGSRYKDRKVCTLGDLACISFFPSKNLGAAGDAGMVVTNDAALAERVRMIANHGSRVRYHHEILGVNSRLDTIQAAILRVKLPHLDEWNRRRREAAVAYNKAFSQLPVTPPMEQTYSYHIYHQYTIRTDRRDALREHLKERGIPTAVHYPMPLHLQPAFKERFGYREGEFPMAEKAARQVLSLPMHPELSGEEIDFIVQAIAQFFNA